MSQPQPRGNNGIAWMFEIDGDVCNMFAKMHRQPPLGYTEFIDFLECGSKFALKFGNLVGMPNVEAVEADAADSSHGLVPCRGKGQKFSLGANKTDFSIIFS